jgi:hypothetical protein
MRDTNDATAMIERLPNEPEKLGMAAAGVLLGEGCGGAPIHATTVTRWCLKGVKVQGGRRVKLEYIRAGGKLITTRPAVVRFLAAQTETPRTPTQRRKAAEAAAAELEAMGV